MLFRSGYLNFIYHSSELHSPVFLEGVRFADLNGDGRAEYLWLDENGAMTGSPSLLMNALANRKNYC